MGTTRTPVEMWPSDELEGVDACPACGGPRRELLYRELRDRVSRAPGEWTLQRCLGCESAYLDPRPTEAAIGRAYEPAYSRTPSHPARPSATAQFAGIGPGFVMGI